MPLPAGYTTVNPLPDETCLNSSGQQEYQSGLGMALYLVKHSRLDLANATRELSKQMIKADVGHLKHLYRLLKFIVDTKEAKLKLKPMKKKRDWIYDFFLRSTGDVEEQDPKRSNKKHYRK